MTYLVLFSQIKNKNGSGKRGLVPLDDTFGQRPSFVTSVPQGFWFQYIATASIFSEFALIQVHCSI